MNEPSGTQMFNTLLQDAAYLQEELNALKQVIGAIPYTERPLEQESVLDMITRIGYAQSACFLPAIQLVMQAGNMKTTIQPDYKKTFQPHDYDDIPVDTIIDRIIAERKLLISLLSEAPSSAIYDRNPVNVMGSKSLYELIEEMVNYERDQLKQVAERVLSIDIDHRSKPDNHVKGAS